MIRTFKLYLYLNFELLPRPSKSKQVIATGFPVGLQNPGFSGGEEKSEGASASKSSKKVCLFRLILNLTLPYLILPKLSLSYKYIEGIYKIPPFSSPLRFNTFYFIH